jgi:predicted nucleic acid-binding protein
VRKYVLDTQLYVNAYRSRDAAAELERFYSSFTPCCYLSSVVLHELLIGSSDPAKARQIQQETAMPFKRTGRIIAPSHSAWERSAETLARLAWEEGLDRSTVPKSFVNDILLAASCREAGVTLVTENTRDFLRIRRLIRFEFTAPWPT